MALADYLDHLFEVANGLFDGFLAPLVIGGEILPGKPVGGRAALAIGVERVVVDVALASLVQLARTRVARKLVAVDSMPPPTVAEWALGAALHDLVQATHPSFRGALRRGTPARILGLVEATLDRIPSPASVGEGLSRHTWFARMFEIERADTVVRWWVGSRTFLGTPPPPRLTAWPELRRVHVERTPRSLVDLVVTAGALDDARFTRALGALLAKTPLTDLATANRTSPAFVWTAEALGLIGARAGRTLAIRALAPLPASSVDAALGRATRAVLTQGAWQAAGPALDLLGERALADAEARDGSPGPELAEGEKADDGSFARAAGAIVARELLASRAVEFPANEREHLLAVLEPRTRGVAAREVLSLLSAEPQGTKHCTVTPPDPSVVH